MLEEGIVNEYIKRGSCPMINHRTASSFKINSAPYH